MRKNKIVRFEEMYTMNFQEIMSFSNLNMKVFKDICKDFGRSAIVPYIGAGMSAFIYPTWSSALKMMADTVDRKETRDAIISKADKMPIDAAEDLAETIGYGNLKDRMKEIFGKEDYDNNLLRKGAISILPYLFRNEYIITTNYDRLLENAFLLGGNPFEYILTPSRINISKAAQQQGAHVLFKLHGDLSHTLDEDIVLTREQYEEAYKEGSPARGFIYSILKNRMLFFLGCSLYQDTIVQILKSLNLNSNLKHYALISCKKEDLDKRRKELDNLGIRAIIYPEKKHEAVEIILREILNKLSHTNSRMLEQPKSIDKDSFVYHEDFYVDTYAQKAHSLKADAALTKAILTQQLIPDRTQRKSQPTQFLSSVCEKILKCKKHCPLMISGQPGTGKSTLLSLIYLNFIPPTESKKYIIDLHKFDNLNYGEAIGQLRSAIDFISQGIKTSKSVYIFVDGLNGYERLSNNLVSVLQSYLERQYKNNKVYIILAVGELDENLFPPFKKSKQLPFFPSEKITLAPIPADSGLFKIMVEKVLFLNGSIPKRCPTGKSQESQNKAKKYNELIDKSITFCKKMGGNYIEFRTVTIFSEGYSLLGDAIFNKRTGVFLLDYFSTQISNKIKLSQYAKDVTEFLLRTDTQKMWTSAIVFKSPVFRDFLFAYHYLEVVKSSNEEALGVFKCIFTASINRILIDLMTQDQVEEIATIKSMIDMYDKMENKAKAQAVYILGRASSSEAKKKAKDFLKKEFSRLLGSLDEVKINQDMAMLFRSVGISLIYLGVTDYENSFYHVLIYDEVIKKININFHIAYYSNCTYRIGDDVSLDSRELCTPENLKRLYSLLWNSVKGNRKLDNRSKRNINIITLVSLYIRICYPEVQIQQREDEVVDFDKKASFVQLLNELSSDLSITNTEIRSYLKNIRTFIISADVYSHALMKLYEMKKIERSGWSEKGREINKKTRVESDADHTWACCMLANIFLTDRIEDCAFLSDEEKVKYADTYSLDKIIRLLLVHDLPEVYTGDIPAKKQDKEKKGIQEADAMQSIAALDSFPGFNSFTNISKLWNEYEKKESINAKIAYHIDQIEPLIQLFIYREFLPKGEKTVQRDDWREYAQNSIQTFAPDLSFGYKLIEFLSKYTLRDDYFSE